MFTRLVNLVTGNLDRKIKEEEARVQKENEYNERTYHFKEDAEVSCLVGKVIDMIDNEFPDWSWPSTRLINNEESGVRVSYTENRYGPCLYYGRIIISGVDFRINSSSVKRILDAWTEVERRQDAEKKQDILKKWGCK